MVIDTGTFWIEVWYRILTYFFLTLPNYKPEGSQHFALYQSQFKFILNFPLTSEVPLEKYNIK